MALLRERFQLAGEVIDISKELSQLDKMIAGVENIMQGAPPEDQRQLQKIGEALARERAFLPCSFFSDAARQHIMHPLASYMAHRGAGQPTAADLFEAGQAAGLIPAAARCGPDLLRGLLAVPLVAWVLRLDLLEEHKASVKSQLEAEKSKSELSEVKCAVQQWAIPFAQDFAPLIGGKLLDFASRDDRENVEALTGYKRSVLAAAASTTPAEALGHLTSGKAHIRFVFAALVKYVRYLSAPLQEAAPLLEYKPRLPLGFSLTCQATVHIVGQIAGLLERAKLCNTLQASSFFARVANGAFISEQLSELTIALAPVLVANNSTSVAASGVVSDQAQRVVAAQAQDRQLRVAEATRDDMARLQSTVLMLMQQVGTLTDLAVQQQQQSAQGQQALAAILAGQEAARATAAGVIVSPFKPVNRDGSAAGSPSKEFSFPVVQPS